MTIKLLEDTVENIKQAGREIYYALSYIDDDNPASANLKEALRALGIQEPRQLYLSDSVLKKRI